MQRVRTLCLRTPDGARFLMFLRITASGSAPLATLRPILLHLRDPSKISQLHHRIIEILNQGSSQAMLPNVVVAECTSEKTTDISFELRRSITTHLFGWDFVCSQRLRYFVACFCQVCERSVILLVDCRRFVFAPFSNLAHPVFGLTVLLGSL